MLLTFSQIINRGLSLALSKISKLSDDTQKQCKQLHLRQNSMNTAVSQAHSPVEQLEVSEI